MRQGLAIVFVIATLAAAPSAAPAASGMPRKVGDCVETAVRRVSTRLEGVDDSGSAIAYRNGGYQVSYATVDAVQRARRGDAIRLCLISVPEECPPGDTRGKVYKATDRRTGLSELSVDARRAEHMWRRRPESKPLWRRR